VATSSESGHADRCGGADPSSVRIAATFLRERRSTARTVIAASFLLGAMLAPVAAAAVTVSPADQTRLGVAIRKLVATRHSTETDAFAKVLDPEPLVQLDSDLVTAEAAATASAAEAARSRALNSQGAAVSAKDTEAAVAQARQDALKVDILRQRLGLEWGPGIARLGEAARGRLVRGLSAGTIALVHVDTHNNQGQGGARFVKVDIGDDSARGRVIGPARAAEPRLQSSGLIVEVDGRYAILLSVGLTQSAHIESTTAETGVMIPREAVIRYRGLAWAYVRAGGSTFERRLIDRPAPEADGFFVAHGFAGGDEVVVGGATALFAAEQSPPVNLK
jgi:hypothetical protein